MPYVAEPRDTSVNLASKLSVMTRGTPGIFWASCSLSMPLLNCRALRTANIAATYMRIFLQNEG